MIFTCATCEGKTFATLRGWKSHQSSQHGGYDENDVAQALQGSGASEDDVAARMKNFAATIPVEGEGESEAEPGPAKDFSNTPPPIPPPKTIKATPKRLKKIIGAIPAKILESVEGMELDDEDREALEEAGEFLTEIFGVEFEIPQSKRTLHSRFWAVVWVAGVTLLIYIKHRFKDVFAQVFEQYKKQAAKQEKEDV